MVAMAVISALVGAGTSFSPLYVSIWGGQMLHPNCPAIGSRPLQTGENGLCVTAPSWFLAVSVACICCVVLIAIAFTHTAESLRRLNQIGNSAKEHDGRFAYVDKVNTFCVVLSCIAVAALVVVSGEFVLMVVVVVWWLLAFVTVRVIRLMGAFTQAWAYGLLIGFASVSFTQLSLIGSISISGGFVGAIICSVATFALQRMHTGFTETRIADDSSAALPVSRWKERIPKGMIAQFFVVLMGYLSCSQYSTFRMRGMKLCPAFSSNSNGGLIDSCIDQRLMSVIIWMALAGLLLSAFAAVVSAITAALRLPRVTRLLMVMSSACVGLALVISFSTADRI